MLPRHHLVILLGVVGLLATSAHASGGWYAGAGVGRASERDVLQGVTLDASEVGIKLFGGHRFGDLLAVEASVTEFNEFVETTGGTTLREEVRNGAVWARIEPPIGDRLYFIAKLGVCHTRTRVNLDRGPDSVREDRSDNALAWALGFGARLTERLAVQFEYDGYETETVTNLELISVGLLFRF